MHYFTDGVFGLAFKDQSITDPTSTPMDNLQAQGKIQNRLACIKLNDLDADVGGELIIGGCDVEADQWIPNGKSGFWQVKLTKVEVVAPNGEVKATHCSGPHKACNAIFDTGADDISMNRQRKKPKIKSTKLKWFHFVSFK